MGLIGAILGDIAGSEYEFRKPAGLDTSSCELFTDNRFFTDDTVLSVATKYAIDNGVPFKDAYRLLGNDYPKSQMKYGNRFLEWLESSNPKPYGSYGNGSAMRVSYIGESFENIEDVAEFAKQSAMCTHNHTEGIKGAIVIATCIHMSEHDKTKEEIYEYVLTQYPSSDYKYGIDLELDKYRNTYRYSETCQGTVPVAIRCFLESKNYESAIRNCFSLNRVDLDTMCAITGGVAESYYNTTGFDNEYLLSKYLDNQLLNIIKK